MSAYASDPGSEGNTAPRRGTRGSFHAESLTASGSGGVADLYDIIARGQAKRPWVVNGLCATHPDPDLWFPPMGVFPKEAVELCQGCPVKNECLEDALARKERHGVWGGKTLNQRKEIQRQRQTTREDQAA